RHLDCAPCDLQRHPATEEEVLRRTAGAQQAQQDVLGADVVVPQRDRLAQRQLQRPPGALRERDARAAARAAARGPVQCTRTERLLAPTPALVEVDAQGG